VTQHNEVFCNVFGSEKMNACFFNQYIYRKNIELPQAFRQRRWTLH